MTAPPTRETTSPDAPVTLSPEQRETWERDGYLILRQLFASDEIRTLRRHFDDLAERGEPIPRYWTPDLSEDGSKDPLRRYPRVMHPHRWDDLSRRYLLDARVGAVLRQLMGEEPIACQSMFYFKPTGARGQAFHQDNFYLRVKPHSCIAAWTAVDPSYPRQRRALRLPRHAAHGGRLPRDGGRE